MSSLTPPANTRCTRPTLRARFRPTGISRRGSGKSTTCLGAQKAAIDAFVVGKSKINDFSHRDPDTLDAVAFNYINTHGKDLHGQPLGKYWLHGLGHMVGIDVHDPAQYPAV